MRFSSHFVPSLAVLAALSSQMVPASALAQETAYPKSDASKIENRPGADNIAVLKIYNFRQVGASFSNWIKAGKCKPENLTTVVSPKENARPFGLPADERTKAPSVKPLYPGVPNPTQVYYNCTEAFRESTRQNPIQYIIVTPQDSGSIFSIDVAVAVAPNQNYRNVFAQGEPLVQSNSYTVGFWSDTYPKEAGSLLSTKRTNEVYLNPSRPGKFYKFANTGEKKGVHVYTFSVWVPSDAAIQFKPFVDFNLLNPGNKTIDGKIADGSPEKVTVRMWDNVIGANDNYSVSQDERGDLYNEEAKIIESYQP